MVLGFFSCEHLGGGLDYAYHKSITLVFLVCGAFRVDLCKMRGKEYTVSMNIYNVTKGQLITIIGALGVTALFGVTMTESFSQERADQGMFIVITSISFAVFYFLGWKNYQR